MRLLQIVIAYAPLKDKNHGYALQPNVTKNLGKSLTLLVCTIILCDLRSRKVLLH
jgi:hypothetical protein